MMTPTERLLAALGDHKCDPKQNGKGWSARCPAHEDRNPSLSVSEGDDGRALVCCHAGCETKEVCAALGLRVKDLMLTNGESRPSQTFQKKPPVIYDYLDEGGELLYQVLRYEPKSFCQRRPDSSGGWIWSTKDARKIPYHLPDLVNNSEESIAIVEGEKDVDNLSRLGVVATCNAGGAGKWTSEHSSFLRNRDVNIFPDNDAAGRTHAREIAESLQSVAKSVRIIPLPGLPEKGDVSDWIAGGGTKAELERLVESAPEWTPETEPWPEIVRFDAATTMPDFPTDALPPVLREWVKAESHAMQTPPELPGLLALAVCSACLARRVEVEPRPGWREPVNLFVAVLLEPANRKSAVFSDATKPLRELEGELIEGAREDVARAESERRQDEASLRKWEKLAAEKDDREASHRAGNLAATLANRTEPVLPRRIVDDATEEKLGMMLADQGGRLASMSPEGGVFDLMAGKYSQSSMPQFTVYLKGHSGDDLITDRVGRKNVRIERPALTCAYAIQPDVMADLTKKFTFRGRGLLGRFLYAAPSSWIGHRQIAPPPVPDSTKEAYRQTIRTLADIFGNIENGSEPIVLKLASDAASLFESWEAEIEEMLGEGGQMEIMLDWGGKLAGATLRLAAVLHCVEHDLAGCIERRTISAAIEIARYLIPHAEAVLSMMSATEKSSEDDARYLMRWINRHEHREFTKRNAHQHCKRRFPKVDDLDPSLDELIKRGFIRSLAAEAKGPGRPTSPAFEVNPAVFVNVDAIKRSHNSHNSAARSEDRNSENIESAAEQFETVGRVRMTI